MAGPQLRVALAQTDTVWHDPQANLAKARRLCEEARAQGARVVVLPELFSTGFTMSSEQFAEPVPGPTTEAVAGIARDLDLYVIGSVIEQASPRPHNVAFAAGPTGDLLAVYRKIHPFSFSDENLHYVGGQALPMFSIDGVKAGLQICYDLRFPETFRALSAAGCQMVFVPANWPTRRLLHWSTLLAARAIENQMVVCGVNRVGTDPHVDYPGYSVVHDARGEVLAHGNGSEGLIVADVDIGEVEAWRAQFPALRDRRPDVYAQLQPRLGETD